LHLSVEPPPPRVFFLSVRASSSQPPPPPTTTTTTTTTNNNNNNQKPKQGDEIQDETDITHHSQGTATGATPQQPQSVDGGGDGGGGGAGPDVHTYLRCQRAVSDFGRLRLLDRTLRDEKLEAGEAKVCVCVCFVMCDVSVCVGGGAMGGTSGCTPSGERSIAIASPFSQHRKPTSPPLP
jgi:hypothetical protein